MDRQNAHHKTGGIAGKDACDLSVYPDRITPQMLALVALDQPQVDCIVETVPGGARNAKDIYPLSPPGRHAVPLPVERTK